MAFKWANWKGSLADWGAERVGLLPQTGPEEDKADPLRSLKGFRGSPSSC